MNPQQIEHVSNLILELKKIDLNEHFSSAFPNENNISQILISRMNVIEFVSLTKRMVRQFEVELKSENKLILPYSFSNPEFGNYDLPTAISNLISNLINKQFPAAEIYLLWLSIYQLQNSFYDKSKNKVHSIDVIELNKTSEELSLLTQNVKQYQEEYKQLVKNLIIEKESLNNFKIQKESELQQISNNLESTNINANQIQALLNKSTQSGTQISSTFNEAEKIRIKIENKEETINKNFIQFKTDSNELLEKISITQSDNIKLYEDFQFQLAIVESKVAYFEDRNKYLDELIGREVGASLFETFKQRKIELGIPLQWWRLAIGVLAIITFAFIIGIYSNFYTLLGTVETSLKWESIVANAFKSLPIFLLLYYAIAQYNKERNFQEEYAFKSAAALTIKAYADLLNDSKNKDELILKAVQGIFKSPIKNDKNNREVHSAFDLVSNAVEKGATIIKK